MDYIETIFFSVTNLVEIKNKKLLNITYLYK